VESVNDSHLGETTVTIYDTRLTEFYWEILQVTDDVPGDPARVLLVNATYVTYAPFPGDLVHCDYPMPNTDFLLDTRMDSVISSSSPKMLNRRGILTNSFNQYLADDMRSYYQTDVALTPEFRFDAVVPQGNPITPENLYRYLPVPSTFARGDITGANLKALFEKELTRVLSGDAFQQIGGYFLGH